ncbi:hypothetical protein OC835_007122 [Tilletia horrida]|nr:hypothetical protein OC835_007122 [Tilletia horrida]
MTTFRLLAGALVATFNLLSVAQAGFDVPDSVFSVADLANGADTRPIKNMYTFGDSYTDNCNGARFWVKDNVNAIFPYPKCPPPPIGRADYGLSWPEIVQNYRPDWNVSIYAVSAATCDSNVNSQGSIDINGQIQLFQTRFKREIFPRGLTDDPATTVATLLVGGNDLALIQAKAWGTLPSYAKSTGSIQDNAMCIKSKLNALHKLGFRRFLLFELPPIDKGQMVGDTPAHAASTAQLIATRNSLAAQYSQDLVKQWNDNSTVTIFPTVKLLTPMVELNPAFKFKYAKGTYCNAVCGNPFDYAWADDLHVSFRAFTLMAYAVVKQLDPNWRKGVPLFSDIQ